MSSYLHHVKPKRVELVVDEMLAIKSEIDAWRDKKATEEANEMYYQMQYERKQSSDTYGGLQDR